MFPSGYIRVLADLHSCTVGNETLSTAVASGCVFSSSVSGIFCVAKVNLTPPPKQTGLSSFEYRSISRFDIISILNFFFLQTPKYQLNLHIITLKYMKIITSLCPFWGFIKIMLKELI